MRMGLSKQMVFVTGVAAVAGGLTLAGCSHKSSVTSWQANGTPVHESVNEPWWNYQLVYHPNSGVYFEPYSHMYHWQEDGEWRSSKRRPGPVAWRAGEAKVVRLNWDTPEYGHSSVAMMHPQMRMWDRSQPITVGPMVNDDTALTSASSNANVKSECTCDDTFTIVMPAKPMPKSSQSTSKPTEITGVTESSSPE